MTDLLQKAFAEASRLPDDEQEVIAAIVLEEMASEHRWSKAFARSQDELAGLADEAIAEFEEGKSLPFESDSDLAHD